MNRSRARRVVTVELGGRALDGVVRALYDVSWGQSRRWIERGKIFVDGVVALDRRRSVEAGAAVELREAAPTPRAPETIGDEQVLHLDPHLIVLLKPASVSTVPYEKLERGTLLDGARSYLARRERRSSSRRGPRPPLFVVQRLDRNTTGVLVLARTWSAAQGLREQFRAHTVHRRYLALAHGYVADGTIRSHLLKDRGDGLRGSRERAVQPKLRGSNKGKLSVTHVKVLERYATPAACSIECRLETGRTNQIRIHLSEAGHPLLGETLYLRDFGGEPLPAPRLMLHAGELGFRHPKSGRELCFEAPVPEDMRVLMASLARS